MKLFFSFFRTRFFLRISKLTLTEILTLTLTLNLTFFIFGEIYQVNYAYNFKPEFNFAKNSVNHVQVTQIKYLDGIFIQLDQCMNNPQCQIKNIVSADDIGAVLAYWIGNKITPTENLVETREGRSHPLSTRIFFFVIHFSLIILLILLGGKFLGKTTTLLLASSLCLFENLFYLTYSNDVYFFPIYVVILSLVFINPSKVDLKYFIITGILVGFFCWFRSTVWLIYLISGMSSLFCYNDNSFAFWKKINNPINKKIFTTLFLAFLIMKIPLLFFNSATHTFWHSLHAGLYEKGGIINERLKFIPKHLIKPDDLTPKAVSFNEWYEKYQIRTAEQINPNLTVFSKEYEEILRKDYLRLIFSNPVENFLFYLRRIPKLLSFYPFKEHSRSGLIENTSHSSISGYLFLVILPLFLFYRKINVQKKILFLAFLFSASLPSFLVHPGYLTYNAPILFVQWMIIFTLLTEFIKNSKEKKTF